MRYRIANRKGLQEFFATHHPHTFVSTKGPPFPDMQYEDGDPVENDINVAWTNTETGRVFELEWEPVSEKK